jgi:hypothetical protein
MDAPAPYNNKWKQYHESLYKTKKEWCKAQIEKVLGISQSAFYRKIKHPDRFLTIAEKWAIAKVYKLDENFLFPELAEAEMLKFS